MGDTVEAAMTMGWGGDEQEAATRRAKGSLTAATIATSQGASATCGISNARHYGHWADAGASMHCAGRA